ncbi:MAG: OmpH family outer membrane protein [Calditrichota bacterium]
MKRNARMMGLFVFSILLSVPAFGQLKIGYVNSDRIMQEWEDAKEAQQKINEEAQSLNQQYSQMVSRLDSLQQEFQRQQFVMSEERRQQKQQEMQGLQKKIQQFQMDNVGPQGQLTNKQQQILGPIMQKINAAIQKIAKNGEYDYVLDAAAGNILYAEEKHDITADVLYELRRTKPATTQ